MIVGLAKRHGCHTCGAKPGRGVLTDSIAFHADHMPPSSIVRAENSRLWRVLSGQMLTQRFYPQCARCSSRQGGLLNAQRSSTSVQLRGHNHALRFKGFYLCGLVLAALTVPCGDGGDVGMPGGYCRLKRLENTAEGAVCWVFRITQK
jgi:hypothetical protein